MVPVQEINLKKLLALQLELKDFAFHRLDRFEPKHVFLRVI